MSTNNKPSEHAGTLYTIREHISSAIKLNLLWEQMGWDLKHGPTSEQLDAFHTLFPDLIGWRAEQAMSSQQPEQEPILFPEGCEWPEHSGCISVEQLEQQEQEPELVWPWAPMSPLSHAGYEQDRARQIQTEQREQEKKEYRAMDSRDEPILPPEPCEHFREFMRDTSEHKELPKPQEPTEPCEHLSEHSEDHISTVIEFIPDKDLQSIIDNFSQYASEQAAIHEPEPKSEPPVFETVACMSGYFQHISTVSELIPDELVKDIGEALQQDPEPVNNLWTTLDGIEHDITSEPFSRFSREQLEKIVKVETKNQLIVGNVFEILSEQIVKSETDSFSLAEYLLILAELDKG